MPLFNPVAKKPFLGRKIIGQAFAPQFMPMTEAFETAVTVLVLFKTMHIMNCLCHSLSSQLIVPSSVLHASCFDKRHSHLSNHKKFELPYVLRQLVTADVI
jgi:hypothetical protein